MGDENKARWFDNLVRMIVHEDAIYHRAWPEDGQFCDLGFVPATVRWARVWSKYADGDCGHCSAHAVVCVVGRAGQPDPNGRGVCSWCGHVNAWEAEEDGWLAPVSLGFLAVRELVAVVAEVDE